MKSKYIIPIIIAGLIITVLPGCSILKKRVEKTEKVEYRITSAGRTAISIENVSGRINVRKTTDTLGYITVSAVKTSSVKYDEQDRPIDNVNIKIDTSGSEVKIETEITGTFGFFKKNNSGKVDYDIKVPADLKVKVENVNGMIIISGIANDIEAENVNGIISVFGCRGLLDLSSVNGSITCNLDSVTAGVNIDVVNGSIKVGGLRGIDADVNASTINGRVKFNDLVFTNVNAEKKSLSGVLGSGGSDIQVSAVNGSITFNADRILRKKNNDFEIKIDFDDDEPVKIIEKNTDTHQKIDSIDKSIDKQTEKTAEPKNADSNKK